VLRAFTKILCFLLFVSSCVLAQAQSDLFRKHYEAANAAHRAGNYNAAESEFKIILGEAYETLAKIYSAQGNYQASAGAFETANSIRPNSTSALIDLSIAQFHLGQFAKGIEPLQRVLAAEPQNATAHHMLGKSYFMMGEFEKAARELEQTLKLTRHAG